MLLEEFIKPLGLRQTDVAKTKWCEGGGASTRTQQ